MEFYYPPFSRFCAITREFIFYTSKVPFLFWKFFSNFLRMKDCISFSFIYYTQVLNIDFRPAFFYANLRNTCAIQSLFFSGWKDLKTWRCCCCIRRVPWSCGGASCVKTIQITKLLKTGVSVIQIKLHNQTNTMIKAFVFHCFLKP